ncbi:AMP-binding protein [Pseudorhodoferax sp.]|uniref:AMP-binding protein n=1 Tax=Pseudorhodoferax sp. TaxID=1993553 RepID=UPI002DD6B8D0|nr:AMP-binding protein [Pseudorhodoferax sp.]
MPRLREIDLPLAERTVPALLARRARAHGERTCLLFEGQRTSYAQADALTDRIAQGLRAAGIARGDHVATLLENSPEALWTYLALGKLGAVGVPMNTAAKGELLAQALVHADCVALVTERALLPRFEAVAPRCPALARLVFTDLGEAAAMAEGARLGRPATAWATLLRAPATPPAAQLRCSDPFLLMYTSGTTGPSKGCLSPHGYAATYGLQRAEAFGYREDDVLFTGLPLFHGNALIGTCFSALVTGAAIALTRRFSVSRFWDEVQASGATQANLLGAMANFLWNQPPGPQDRAHRLRQCTVVPVPAFGAAFEQRFGVALTSVYALSDYGMGTLLGPDHPPAKKLSAGLPAPGVEVAVVDDEDMPQPPGSPGEIVLRAHAPWTTGQGYWKMPEATVASRRNLWFHTGDRGYLDADGYLYFVDRKKDAIRRRGENISSWEIEQTVQRHPAVAAVAAYAVPGVSEDEVMVSVVLRAGQALAPAELVAYCQQEMAYFMVPRYVDIVAELPRTLTEKVEKYKLRAEAVARLGQVWDREKAGIRVGR